jgi:hypothetical protein
MKQEDKDLLLQDLCARLPYGVKAYIKNWSKLDRKYYEGVYTVNSVHPSLNSIYGSTEKCGVEVILGYSDYFIRPYLFPLSSMTEEQKIECFKGTDIELDEHNEIWSTFPISNSDIVLTNLNNWLKVINWLNKNHFDYRGLIEKDLAFDATGLNIY